ncbi:MAG: leucine-rich repeat domain-containing protein [Ruminiclostridium sp.]|nr:leucine-rich repeat domain-containing protein [Ruminiclostridium sp.]
MLCQNCQAKLPIGKVLCPECKHLNPYNIVVYSNTKAVQTALRKMIDEQYERIGDNRQFVAVMYDYLPDYDMERKLLKKAVEAGFLDEMFMAVDKKSAFKSMKSKLIKEAGFMRYDAEFVLACFGHMFGFAYVSPFIEYDAPPKQDEAAEKIVAAHEIRPKIFGKFDAFRYALSGRITVKEGYTGIAGYCFENYGLMKEISLPETISSIGEYAFSDCKSLESIVVPGLVRKLEKGVFSACLGLKKASLPEGLLSIGDNCFFCCTSLKTLRIPDSVSSIGENAFSGCASLEKLIVPKNVKFIDSNAFAYCGKMTVICTENSFVHKYCMQNEIKYRTLPVGVTLPGGDGSEDEPDERA